MLNIRFILKIRLILNIKLWVSYFQKVVNIQVSKSLDNISMLIVKHGKTSRYQSCLINSRAGKYLSHSTNQ